jgi:hypothetical protein
VTRCVVCGGLGPVHSHHVTGKAKPELPYLDPALVIPLCAPRCHSHEHVAVRRSGLESPAPGGELAHRLARVADHAIRSADAGRGLVLSSESTRALGHLLLDALPTARRSTEAE